MGKKEQLDTLSRRNRLYLRYRLLALNVFEWENLPKGMESRHIEEALYEHGQAVFFMDESLGYLCLKGTGIGLNVYGDPTSMLAIGCAYSKNLTIDNCVRILNNDNILPTSMYIRDYSDRMVEIENSINSNVKQQKFSWFVECDVNTEATMKTVYNKVMDGEPVIFGKKATAGNINFLNTNTPFRALELNQYRKELENEMLSFLGLNNAEVKKERLIVDEVNANNSFIDRNIECMYKNRLLACEIINEKYGLNINVIKKNDVYIDLEKSRGNIEEEETWQDTP